MEDTFSGPQGAFTVDDFCKAYSISRAYYYVLTKKGKGPRFFHVGTRRLISYEAASEWQRSLEAKAAP